VRSRDIARGIFALVVSATAIDACSSTTAEVATRCLLGATRSCRFDAACEIAIETCGGDPPAWGPCLCTRSKPTDSGTKPSNAPEGDIAPRVGQACHADTECDPGAFCLLRAVNYFFGGGPPKGVCVADCSAGQAVCQRFQNAMCIEVAPPRSPIDAGHGTSGADAAKDAPANGGGADASGNASADAGDAARDASDVTDSGGQRDARTGTPVEAGGAAAPDASPTTAPMPTALCFKTCELGPGVASKCFGTPHVACAPLFDVGKAGFCRPTCASTKDCASTGAGDGPARKCDVRSGVCVDAPGNADAALGKLCDAATAPFCNGSCVNVTNRGLDGADAARVGASICSHACVIGDPIDCGESKTSAFDGACLETPAARGTGDVGYCRKLCDCPTDCATAQACVPFGDPGLAAGFGRRGVCTPTPLVTGPVTSCK
jgi:hypothetical protein